MQSGGRGLCGVGGPCGVGGYPAQSNPCGLGLLLLSTWDRVCRTCRSSPGTGFCVMQEWV